MMILYSVPSLILLLAAIVVAVAVAGGGQIYVHHRFRDQDFVQHNEVGGIIIAVVGSVYAVVLGFLTVIVWQHFRAERQLVILESAAATDAWHTAVIAVALQDSAMVQTLSLLEPAFVGMVPSGASFSDALTPAGAKYQSGSNL